MDPIIIQALTGDKYVGTWWAVTEGGTELEVYETKQKAINKARTRFAYPEQAIKVKNTNGTTETIRTESLPGDDGHDDRSGGGGGGLPGMGNGGLPGMNDGNGGDGFFW